MVGGEYIVREVNVYNNSIVLNIRIGSKNLDIDIDAEKQQN